MNISRNAPLNRCVSGFVVMLCLGASSLLWAHPTWALGVSPASIQVTDLSPQSKIKKEIYISRANPKSTDYVSVTVTGSGAQAIQIENGDKFELLQGIQNTLLPFTIAPKGFPKGEYEAFITVQTLQAEESQGGSAILTGSQAKVTFTVTTDEIEPFVLDQVSIEEVQEQRLVVLKFQATNNSKEQMVFGQIEFQATDQTSGVTQKATVDGKALQPIPAFTQQDYTVETDLKLPAGEYSAHITLVDSEKIILGEHDFTFTVVKSEHGPATQEEESNPLLFWLVVGSLGVLGFASAGVCSFTVVMKKRGKKIK